MQLTEQQRSYVVWQAYRYKRTVQEILEEEFQRANITLLRGYDLYEEIPYTIGVFLSEDEAELAMAGLSSRAVCNLLESLNDTAGCKRKPHQRKREDANLYMITTTVEKLRENSTVDTITETQLNKDERNVVYLLLESRLCGQE